MSRKIITTFLVSLIISQALLGFSPINAAELSLTITQAIPSIPADGKPHSAFFISILDSGGKPHPLTYPLNVTISSSDERVLQIQKNVKIEAVSYYALVNATSNVIESKQVEVTVSASGFQSSKITASVGPPAGSPSSLKVTILPNVLLPLAASEAEIIVTVIDSYGNPTKARSDLTVSLSSSNLKIADLSSKTILLLKNNISAKSKVVTTGFPGTCSITASVSNLKSDSAILNVVGPKPERIYIWSSYSQVVGENGYLSVAIVDSGMKPVKLVSPMTINLYSSNSSRIDVQNTITIGAGEWITSTRTTCNDLGQATITATAKDLQSATLTLNGVESGGDAYSVAIYPMFNYFLADDFNYTSAFLVQVLDINGLPTTSHEKIDVDLFSSNSAIFSLSSDVEIDSGESLAIIRGEPKVIGDVTITAVASNLKSGQTGVSSYVPVPDTVNIQYPPMPSDGEVEACLLITASGIPVPVLQDTIVKLSSSNTGIGSTIDSATLLKKKSFSYLKISGSSPGQFYITASGNGIPSNNVPISVSENKPKTFYLSYVKPVVNYNFPMVIQLVSSQGISAVTYDPITINIAASNITNINIPLTITIKPDSTETIIQGKGLSPSLTTLTMSSPGFNSITATITPIPINISIQLIADPFYPIGEIASLKAKVLLDDIPVQGITVNWIGDFTINKSITNTEGVAQNTLTIKEGQNSIEAAINIGGTGSISTKKSILGVIGNYDLNISSNIPLNIQGSGKYKYGEQVPLDAPTSVAMQGLLGILGGKYVFKHWTGAVESTSNQEVLFIKSNQQVINVQAVYSEDYFMAIITGVVLLAVIGGAVFIYFKKFRKPKPSEEQLSEPEIKDTSPKPPKTPESKVKIEKVQDIPKPQVVDKSQVLNKPQVADKPQVVNKPPEVPRKQEAPKQQETIKTPEKNVATVIQTIKANTPEILPKKPIEGPITELLEIKPKEEESIDKPEEAQEIKDTPPTPPKTPESNLKIEETQAIHQPLIIIRSEEVTKQQEIPKQQEGIETPERKVDDVIQTIESKIPETLPQKPLEGPITEILEIKPTDENSDKPEEVQEIKDTPLTPPKNSETNHTIEETQAIPQPQVDNTPLEIQKQQDVPKQPEVIETPETKVDDVIQTIESDTPETLPLKPLEGPITELLDKKSKEDEDKTKPEDPIKE